MLPEMFGDADGEMREMWENFLSLPPLQRDILRMIYEDDLEIADLMVTYRITEHQAIQRVNRAVYSLTDLMNTDPYESIHGQWDTRGKGRRAISNAAARLRTDGMW
jgi:hypothetical protein